MCISCSNIDSKGLKSHQSIPNCLNVPEDRWDWTWKAFDNSRRKYYNENSRLFEQAILDLHNGALDRFVDAGDSDAGMFRARQYIETEGFNILDNAYQRVYENTAQGFASGVTSHIKQDEVELGQVALLAIRDFITANMFSRINKVQETNKSNAQKFLQGALRSVLGLGADQRIPKVTNINELNEAALIVRSRLRNRYAPTKADVMSVTETATASNLGLLAAAQALPGVIDKAWLSQRDNRVRLTHTGADGQRIKLNDTFNVGGFRMQFPGDWSLGAPAEEIINCRCVLIFFNR